MSPAVQRKCVTDKFVVSAIINVVSLLVLTFILTSPLKDYVLNLLIIILKAYFICTCPMVETFVE